MLPIYFKRMSIGGKEWFCWGQMQERFELDARSSRWKDSMMAQWSVSKKLISHLERCRKLWCAEGGGLSRPTAWRSLKTWKIKMWGKMRWRGESRGDKTSWGFKSVCLIQVCRKAPHPDLNTDHLELTSWLVCLKMEMLASGHILELDFT